MSQSLIRVLMCCTCTFGATDCQQRCWAHLLKIKSGRLARYGCKVLWRDGGKAKPARKKSKGA